MRTLQKRVTLLETIAVTAAILALLTMTFIAPGSIHLP
jgi:hypothetical protein